MKKLTNELLKALGLVVCLSAFSAFASVDWTSSGSYTIGKTSNISIKNDDGVYLKLSGLKAGSDYTLIANGTGAGVELVYTYSDGEELWDTMFGETTSDVKTANQERCIVTSDDWINEGIVKDPDYEYEPGEWEEWKVTPKGYYVHVMGDVGETITLSSMNGAVEEPIPVGDAENPKSLVPALYPTTYKASYVNGAYYFVANGRQNYKYLFATVGGTEETPISLSVDPDDSAYDVEDVSETVSKTGNKAYLVTMKKSGEIGFNVKGDGNGFGLLYQYASDGVLGQLTVNTKGTDGKWSIKGATGTYENGETIVIFGQQTVVFSKVTGFSTPANQVALPTALQPEVELLGVYNDTYDPNDDDVSKATALALSSKEKYAARTLFEEDPYDHFSFSAKAGYYYDFSLDDLEGDAEIVIFKKGDEDETILAGPSTSILRQTFDAGNYILRVRHGKLNDDAQYNLAYLAVNAGTVSFAKTTIKAAKTTGSVKLTVNRSSSEGRVRVQYGTVNVGDALPGVDYIAQNGVLEWADGDKKAKTIEIKLLPELFAHEAVSREFKVELKPMAADDIEDDEYPAVIAAGKGEAVVTVTEAKGKTPTAVKPATVKTTEDAPLETGTYQGVIVEDGSALTNGFPALASVSFTSKNAAKKALSAKVSLAGKTYTFAADTWTATGDGFAHAQLVCKQKVNKIEYANVLDVVVPTGDASDDWTKAVAEVELTMNVPDANSKGVQENIFYSGRIYRDCSKVQDYLYAVTNAVGYYTVALAPNGVLPGDGIPAGNGYLTITIDNKGKAKIAGMLSDGTTKPSYTSVVAMGADQNEFFVPVYVAKSPYCFGGELRFARGADGRFVVDSTVQLLWNNDNALLTYDGEEGWRMMLDPVGGYFNTVNNLQAYYKTCTFSVSTVDDDNWLDEALTLDYDYRADVRVNEFPVSLVGNTFSTEKRSLYKEKGAIGYDFDYSVNPCNVQVKLTRATGVVTGSFSLWSETAEGKQKEITGLKHYGILLLSRDAAAPLDPDVMTAGFFNQTATIKYTVTDAKGKVTNKTRKYTSSMPFNILAVDQGEPDWYADDWGEIPEEED